VPVLKLLSGGAAHGLVAAVMPEFSAKTGCSIDGSYGAVGVMARRLRDGEAVDVMILTAALIAQLAKEGLLAAGSVADIGVVETAIAVRTGDPPAPIADEQATRAAFLAADAIYVPDVVSSTAGAHVAKVLRQLGIFAEVEGRLKVHANGATAMRELAASKASRPIGCTQTTEIIITPGLTLGGVLPASCALATVYTAAVTARAADPASAQALIDILVSGDRRDARQRAGFLEIASDS
jgi:molybdate transport system substrate-binding protein